MFFPRLRRQAKWMFVFLAVIFGLGYVIFNVGGSIPGTGLGDVLQGLGQQSSSGPSVGDSQDKIKERPNDPTGYRELSTALVSEGRNAEAIQPLERYVQMKPSDREALRQLGGLHMAQARIYEEQGAIGALAEHPLPKLVAAGVQCSISTDDPAMFDTDLTRDYDAARSLGVDPRSAYEAGVEGALCDEATRERLRAIGRDCDWARLPRAELV